MRTSLLFALLVAALLSPTTGEAQSAPSPFRVDLQGAEHTPRGLAVQGYLYNELPWRITNVRLRVESVDPAGRVIGETSGWVPGNVPAGGRAYFLVPVPKAGAAYRASVESFDRVSLEAP